MPITSVSKDTDDLTMTVVADFPVPVRRLWDAYADPRQLERFWGPVEWPATFSRHDMTAAGESHYVMTGPEGETSAGYWKFLSVDEGKGFEVEDGFASEPGVPNRDMPSMRMSFAFEETGEGSRVTTTTWFASLQDLEQLIAGGMEEGMTSAMGQMDEVLADLASFAAGSGTQTQLLDDTHVRVTRVIRGTVEQVWRAHTEPDLMKRWLLGPDGWTMPVCEVATEVGDTYRYEWEQEGGGNRFGFTGELLEVHAPIRSVTTERMIGMEGEGTLNEQTLTPVEGGTLLTVVITYPSRELRDQILATGMTDGMETSYARLEREVLATV
ncbi:SRPBCC domain-containing protein [Aeromicrobium sp. Marseille-Q0843]|uniref:SRPBCC domain-containing protein n=1 Tax=Aeromicrobium phoceense TaxID=2754045 RepID=A0A838XHW8_9ACTN|nr:SRPBCC family protein [Aeromicrobium phoceense]MBA4609672.1 SRPBCC domain-containing protein [Aeromicrobium phoceense]